MPQVILNLKKGMFWHRQNVTLHKDFGFTLAPYVNNVTSFLVVVLLCIPPLGMPSKMLFFPLLLSDQTVRDGVLQKGVRDNRGSFQNAEGASVVICCKKKRGRKKETQGSIYLHLLLEVTLKRSMRSASYAWRRREHAGAVVPVTPGWSYFLS